jgi:hypothetical protein
LSQKIAEVRATSAPTARWAGEKRRELTVRYTKCEKQISLIKEKNL